MPETGFSPRSVKTRSLLRRVRSAVIFSWWSIRFFKKERSRQKAACCITSQLIKAGAQKYPRDDYRLTPLEMAEVQHGPDAKVISDFRHLLGPDDGDTSSQSSELETEEYSDGIDGQE